VTSISIGLDLGSTGLRTAWPDGSGRIETHGDSGGGLLLYEQPAANALGVDFPALKGVLGSDASLAVDGQPLRPVEVMSEALNAIRVGVEHETGRRVAQAIVAVPARYATSQRTVLREAALDAGFSDLQLVSDSACAVIGHTAGSDSGSTVLVYSLGYSGLELALVRGKRGHLRALGYEGDVTSGGRLLDQVVLQLWIEAFRQRDLVFDSRAWGPRIWTRLRAQAEATKEQLSGEKQATLDIRVSVPGSGQQAPPVLTRAAFEEAIAPSVAASIERIRALLEQTASTAEDIEAVLLVGGSTRIPFIREAVARELGCVPILAGADEIARGAALHAARLTTGSPDALEDSAGVAAQHERPPRRGPLRPAPRNGRAAARGSSLVAIPAGDEDELADPLPTLAMLEDYARRLAAGGRAGAAGDRLRALVCDAGAVLDKLCAMTPDRAAVPRMAAEALDRAEALLADGSHAAAVAHAHLAWAHAGESPEVFDQMVEIHCRAAMASDRYEDAVEWLTCAYGHDQSNERVRGLLAERHYVHAKELGDRRRPRDALRAIDAALRWSPDHVLAQELRQALRQR
jgi:hypothetical protein